MLDLLRTRSERTSPNARLRLQTHHTDALSYLIDAPSSDFDLVVTHFFLDCLTQPEVEALAATISARLAPGAVWLVSDFTVPAGTLRLPAKLFLRSLYLAFRILTGLRISCLPDHALALGNAGFVNVFQVHSLCGMLTTELWSVPQIGAQGSGFEP